MSAKTKPIKELLAKVGVLTERDEFSGYRRVPLEQVVGLANRHLELERQVDAQKRDLIKRAIAICQQYGEEDGGETGMIAEIRALLEES